MSFLLFLKYACVYLRVFNAYVTLSYQDEHMLEYISYYLCYL